LGRVSEEVVQDFVSIGAVYRYVLEHSESFKFWRGLVDDLDVTELMGEHEGRRNSLDPLYWASNSGAEWAIA
jgi:hypothetical protein